MSIEANSEHVDFEAKSKTFEEENEKLKLALTEVIRDCSLNAFQNALEMLNTSNFVQLV